MLGFSTWRHPPWFDVAGVALGDINFRFAWQAALDWVWWALGLPRLCVVDVALLRFPPSFVVLSVALGVRRGMPGTVGTALSTFTTHTRLCHTQLLQMQLFHTPPFQRKFFHKQLFHTHTRNSFICTTLAPETLSHTHTFCVFPSSLVLLHFLCLKNQ